MSFNEERFSNASIINAKQKSLSIPRSTKILECKASCRETRIVATYRELHQIQRNQHRESLHHPVNTTKDTITIVTVDETKQFI